MAAQTMTAMPIPNLAARVESVPRVILDGISWQTYQHLLADRGERSGIRLTYDQGRLEIMVTSMRHENPNRTLAALIEFIAIELGLDLVRAGSMTFQREDLAKGFEPDTGFYIQQADLMLGKTEVDLATDPPPDLIIEIDITHPSLDRFPIFAAIGVREVWRYQNKQVTFYRLNSGKYAEIEYSVALPILTSADATRFLADSLTLKSTTWTQRIQQWARAAISGE